MEPRDRLGNLGLLAAAAIAWVLVGLVVLTRDPIVDPTAGFIGGGLMGLAVGLTTVPLFWLAWFARQRRIAFRGDWLRAGRRGAWVGIVTAVFVLLRLQGALQLPIALFLVTIVLVAEVTLSAEH
ncbi:MAG TPA: hypothetical protein VEY67_01035 [Candidatus Dormibacteraeota bacterium]|nr:hypothetical protein [Candidatus Dormibacteraeota bacterium]